MKSSGKWVAGQFQITRLIGHLNLRRYCKAHKLALYSYRTIMKSESLTFVSGLSLVIPLALMMLSKNVPSELYPLPVIVAIPALLGLGHAAPVGPMLLFFLWNPGLFRGEVKVPKRSSVLLVIATLLSVPWFVVGWKYG